MPSMNKNDMKQAHRRRRLAKKLQKRYDTLEEKPVRDREKEEKEIEERLNDLFLNWRDTFR